MVGFGGILLLFGAASIAFAVLSIQLSALAWVDRWGELVGWAIRIAATVGGGIMLYLGFAERVEAIQQANPDRDPPRPPG